MHLAVREDQTEVNILPVRRMAQPDDPDHVLREKLNQPPRALAESSVDGYASPIPTGGTRVTIVLELDEIKRLIDIPQLIREIEVGFVLYSEGQVKVPPVGFLHFDEPPGDVHIK